MWVLVVGLSLLLASSPAFAAEQWTPTSRTAIAITGPITISGNTITFGNGATISVRPVGATRPGVYVIDPPQNPALMNGNRLCGDDMPTFLVLARDGDALYFKAFNRPEPPIAVANPLSQPGTCATFNFQGASGSSLPANRGETDDYASDTTVRRAQEALNWRNYDAGDVDGIMGSRTRQALTVFQRDHNLAVTGEADGPTMAALVGNAALAGPSFDCRKAGTPVEREICASPVLGRLDAEMAAAYRDRIASLSPLSAEQERERQRLWLAERDHCGPHAKCLAGSYSGRIAALRREARIKAPPGRVVPQQGAAAGTGGPAEAKDRD